MAHIGGSMSPSRTNKYPAISCTRIERILPSSLCHTAGWLVAGRSKARGGTALYNLGLQKYQMAESVSSFPLSRPRSAIQPAGRASPIIYPDVLQGAASFNGG